MDARRSRSVEAPKSDVPRAIDAARDRELRLFPGSGTGDRGILAWFVEVTCAGTAPAYGFTGYACAAAYGDTSELTCW